MPDEKGFSIHTDSNVDKSVQIAGDKNIVKIRVNWFISNRIAASIALTVLMIVLIYWGHNWYARKQILNHHLSIAHDFLRIGQYEKAKAAYQKISEIDKENAKSAEGIEIINALEELKDETKPIENIRLTANRLLRQSPDNPFVHLLFGHYYADDNNTQKAQQYYEKALSLDSSFAEAYFSLGVLLQKQKKYREALENFEKAVQYSELSPYLTNLAYSYFKAGQHEKSLEIYEKVLNSDRFYILVYCEIANVYCKMKQYEESLKYLNHALDKLNDPKISDMQQNQGNWYFESGETPVYVSGIAEKKYYVLQAFAATWEQLGDSRKAQEYRTQAQLLGIDDGKSQKIRWLTETQR
jgi:tetratricopeptide (TPR) repeat protein